MVKRQEMWWNYICIGQNSFASEGAIVWPFCAYHCLDSRGSMREMNIVPDLHYLHMAYPPIYRETCFAKCSRWDRFLVQRLERLLEKAALISVTGHQGCYQLQSRPLSLTLYGHLVLHTTLWGLGIESSHLALPNHWETYCLHRFDPVAKELCNNLTDHLSQTKCMQQCWHLHTLCE